MHTMTTIQTRPTIPAAGRTKLIVEQHASHEEVRRGLTTLRPQLYARALKLSRDGAKLGHKGAQSLLLELEAQAQHSPIETDKS